MRECCCAGIAAPRLPLKWHHGTSGTMMIVRENALLQCMEHGKPQFPRAPQTTTARHNSGVQKLQGPVWQTNLTADRIQQMQLAMPDTTRFTMRTSPLPTVRHLCLALLATHCIARQDLQPNRCSLVQWCNPPMVKCRANCQLHHGFMAPAGQGSGFTSLLAAMVL